jgi:ferredoxin
VAEWDERAVIEEIRSRAWMVTEFFCAGHPSPYKAAKDRERGAVRLPGCLGALTPGAWYAAGLCTAVELHTENCAECQVTNGLTRLRFKADTAAEWLVACGQTVRFSMLRESRQGKVRKRWKAVESGYMVTSRRDLFLSLLGKKEGPRLERGTESGAQPARRKRLSAWQRHLAADYRGPAGPESAPAFWPVLRLEAECINCGLCSDFCPSGALSAEVQGGECRRFFTGGFCLDCRLCELFCPKEAVRRERAPVAEPFRTVPVYTAKAVYCRRCTRLTFDEADGLCFWCRESDAIEAELTSACRRFLPPGT